jgi:regulatory protein
MSDAYDEGLRLLARRALTRAEVEQRLAARGHDPSSVEDAVSRLVAAAVLDDAALARHWIGSTATARGRGRKRALAELTRRGVAPEVAASAWSRAVADGDIDESAMVRRAVRRRLGPAPGRANEGRLARVYNALLYEGFTREQVASALSPYGFEGMDG